jgi:hypothetical protein
MRQLDTRARIVTVALAAVSWGAHAGRPFATEDAGVLEQRRCEVESYRTATRDKSPARESQWWFQGGCGIGGKTQLGVGGGRRRVDGAGVSGAALVGKTAIYAMPNDGPSFTAAYSFSSSKSPESSWKQPWSSWQQGGTSAALVVSVPGSNTQQWHANLGWLRSREAPRNATWWALGWERGLGEAFNIGAEVYGTDREAAWVGLGGRWLFRENLGFDVSLARQTNGLHAQQWSLGLKFGW